MRDRAPSVAGTFYESTAESLRKRLEWCFLHRLGPGSLPSRPKKALRSMLGMVSPHAGFIYSGPIAAHGYYQLSTEPAPKVVAIIGPNHTGMGAGVSVWDGGDWETPLGKVPVERGLARAIADAGVGELDGEAHQFEHSVEVQLPFLQYSIGEGFKILPICMMLQDTETSAELGVALAKALMPHDALVIASTDFSHYEPYSVAYKKDSKVAEEILKLNPAGVASTVERESVSMCGPGPVMATIVASKAMGATTAEKLCYATSGDTSGSKGEVVGYASFSMKR